jgi:hypothetical protein
MRAVSEEIISQVCRSYTCSFTGVLRKLLRVKYEKKLRNNWLSTGGQVIELLVRPLMVFLQSNNILIELISR